ncbi:MAG: hypothetical protein GXP59_00840 [Deltaproteobacteria bacterium]|nr:hypothetical protein [Deltaproteobacteria bacterium]
MQKWEIRNKEVWLCEACMRQLSPVIMRGSWEWLDESHDYSLCCARCRCNDLTVKKFGRFRQLFRFLYQPFKPMPNKAKAYRRAI